MMVKQLTDLHHRFIHVLARIRYATAEQLLFWLPVSDISSVRRHGQRLEKLGLVEISQVQRPYLYRLSARGCQFENLKHYRHWQSSSAMHQVLLRNQVEIELRGENPKARMVQRKSLSRLDLYPAHGEHAYMMPGTYDLFLFAFIDDYLIKSDRLTYKWSRPHLVESKQSATDTVKRWCDVSDAYRVYCVCPFQAEKHIEYLEKHRV